MYKRINITLPESTLRLMERVAAKGERSRLVDEALKQYLRGVTRKSLKKRIKEGSLHRFERDRALAEEWFLIDEEVWPKDQRR
jgi:CopG family transcriptional regulator / antitoxin EndoAI